MLALLYAGKTENKMSKEWKVIEGAPECQDQLRVH